MKEPKEFNPVASLAKGLAILRAFRGSQTALSSREIATRTGLPAATVARLIKTLQTMDYLKPGDKKSEYILTSRAADFGRQYLADATGLRELQPFFQRFANDNELSIGLAKLDDLDALFLLYAASHETRSLRIRVGSMIPAYNTATGQALLSLLSEVEQEQFKRDFLEEKGRAPEDLKLLDAQLDQVRSTGFAESVGGWRSEVTAVASPLPSTMIGDLAIVAFARRLNAPDEEITSKLRAALESFRVDISPLLQ